MLPPSPIVPPGTSPQLQTTFDEPSRDREPQSLNADGSVEWGEIKGEAGWIPRADADGQRVEDSGKPKAMSEPPPAIKTYCRPSSM
jgi:hypothetical protein